jgi:gag-polypeptide of LTR copia-type
MSLISKPYTLSYVRNKDMGEYVYTYTSLLNRLAAMNAPIPDALAVIMFLRSLQGHFEATVAAIRSISDDNLTWDDVTSCLIEEASSPRSRTRQDSALDVHSRPICSFFGLKGHEANGCFTNPSNPNNRFGTPRHTHRLSVLVPTDVQPWFMLLTPTAWLSRRLPFGRTLPSLRLQHLLQPSTRRGPATEEAPVLIIFLWLVPLLMSFLILHP